MDNGTIPYSPPTTDRYDISQTQAYAFIRWWYGIYPYVKTKAVFCCPDYFSANPKESVTYDWNQAYQGAPLIKLTTPSVNILLYDRGQGGWLDFDSSDRVTSMAAQNALNEANPTGTFGVATGHGQAVAPGPYAYLNTQLGNGYSSSVTGGSGASCAGDYFTTKTTHNQVGDNYLFADGHVKYAVWNDPTVGPMAMANDMYPVIDRNICWY